MPSEPPVARRFRRFGLALLLLASLLPYHGCIAHPVEFDRPGRTASNYSRDTEPYVPAAAVELAFRQSGLRQEVDGGKDLLLGTSGGGSDDYGWYVFFGVPVWLALLGLSRRPGSRLRLAAGWTAWVLSAGLPVAITWGLLEGEVGLGPRALRTAGAWAAGAVAAAILLLRPPGRRHPSDLEATLSTHAVVALGVVFCRPVLDSLEWLFRDGHSGGAVLLALLHNYRPGFYLTVPALLMLAAPLYFSGEALSRRYDPLRPWRPPSSTATPTSTSTGSTPTGTPSSTGPGPPASSPS